MADVTYFGQVYVMVPQVSAVSELTELGNLSSELLQLNSLLLSAAPDSFLTFLVHVVQCIN